MKINAGMMIVGAVITGGCWSMASNKVSTANAASTPIVEISSTPKPTPSKTSANTPTNANSDTSVMKDGSTFAKNLATDFEYPTDDSGKLLMREYGSVFVARGGAKPPSKVVFKDAADVDSYQASLDHTAAQIGGMKIDLQTAALKALQEAIAEARTRNLTIGPRGGDSSRRGYKQTVDLWASRVGPGLAHWTAAGKITSADAARIKAMTPYQQVPEILKLESQQIYFAKDLSKSIIYSVAPPGTSQHLSMLALDVKEFENPQVRAILAKHGWFQTVTSDLPHFTFLGVSESELPGLGLKRVDNSGRTFWVPDI